jgi:hypothetical protein
MFGIFYLSYFGVETKRFNNLIQQEIKKKSKFLDLELKKVKILLNLKNYTVSLKTIQPNIILRSKRIELEDISTSFSLSSIFNKKFAVDEIKISTKETKIEDFISILRAQQNSPQLFVLSQIIKKGLVKINFILNFDENGKIRDNYKIYGNIKNAKIKLLGKKYVNKLNFSYIIKKNEYKIHNSSALFENLNLSSKIINIKNNNKTYLIDGNLDTLDNKIESKLLNLILGDYLKNFNLTNLNLGSKNKFSFKINNKFKIDDVNIKSQVKLNEVNLKFTSNNLKNYLPHYNNFINLTDHQIELNYKKNS